MYTSCITQVQSSPISGFANRCMLISIAPALLQATRTAILFWTLATGGQAAFEETASCAQAENQHLPCISVSQVSSLSQDRLGVTYRFNDQYIMLVLSSDVAVITHEIGHYVIDMRYHAAPRTSIMSPAAGKRCLTQEDAKTYEAVRHAKLNLWCI